MPPFFTIITATYNAEHSVAVLLESLAAQTCRDFVWLVQDGGSKDGTLARIEAGRGLLPAVDIFSAPDKGIYDAWNKALDRAGDTLGQWVLFLRADDALAAPDVLESARQLLAAMPESVLLASGGVLMLGRGGVEHIPGTAEGACARLRRDMPFCHTALFHRGRLFASLRFDPHYKVLGDYDLVCRVLRHDAQVHALPHTITRMRRGGVSGSLCMQPAIWGEACRIARRHFGALQGHHVKVALKVGVVALLCFVLGGRRAERCMDEVRRWRGKAPVWYNPPHSHTPLDASHCAVVLVHYNNPGDTLACLAALEQLLHLPAHVAVVDNGSRPEELYCLRQGWQQMLGTEVLGEYSDDVSLSHQPLPRCLLLNTGRNTGFSGGNNAALRVLMQKSDCSAFWLLNNDTLPDAHALDALCARLNERPEAGLCGSTLVYAHAPDTVQAAGGCRYSSWTGHTRFLRGGDAAATVAALSLQDVQAIEAQTDYVVGASCLIRRQVLESAGLLPEEYFLYYEDVAFALRVRRAGYALAWARDSRVLHKEGASTHAGTRTARPRSVDYLTIRNRMAVIRGYSPWALPVALASLVGVALNRVRRGQADRLGLVARAAWDGLRGKMGACDGG